jgi:hypothetical protein
MILEKISAKMSKQIFVSQPRLCCPPLSVYKVEINYQIQAVAYGTVQIHCNKFIWIFSDML